MSHHKLEIILSEAALQELDDILQYTLETWGEAQMDIYAAKLESGFRLLQNNPHIGKPKDDWFSGCRCHHIEHHLILYSATESAIRISRIFHENREISLHLEAKKLYEQDRER